MEILRTENLCKKYGKNTVVNNVNMTVEKGDIYGFIGKNGAGKTTLMRMILTLATPSDGKIYLFGSENLREGCKKTGSLIEYPALPKHITAKEALSRYGMLYDVTPEKIDELLDIVGLDRNEKKKINQFSLGMKQRLGIAIALLNEPEFLVLDEPLNGLDPMGMKEIRDLILKLNKERGITFIISSHLLEELAKTATKIGIINDGILIEETTMDAIEANCLDKLVFTVNDTNMAEEILRKNQFDSLEIDSDNRKVYVTCDSNKAADINHILVTAGIQVSGIETAGYNLEDYYMEKVGAKDVKIN